jgi:phage gp36-like protein
MYCTVAQMILWYTEAELIQRTDKSPFTGTINETIVNEAISSAQKKIDGYLRTVYTLPLADSIVTDSDLPKTCGDIARYNLHADLTLEDTSPVKVRYDEAMRWLRDVQAKRVSLGSQDDSVAETGSAVINTARSNIDYGSY